MKRLVMGLAAGLVLYAALPAMAADVSAGPVLTGFSLRTPTVAAPGSLEIELGVDSVSGVTAVRLYYQHSGGMHTFVHTGQGLAAGTHTLTFPVEAGLATGSYRLFMLQLAEANGGVRSYSLSADGTLLEDFLSADRIPCQPDLLVEGPAADTTAPLLTAINPLFTSLTAGDTFTLAFELEEEQSGLAQLTLNYRHNTSNSVYSLVWQADTPLTTGPHSLALETDHLQEGAYTLQSIQLQDAAGNLRSYISNYVDGVMDFFTGQSLLYPLGLQVEAALPTGDLTPPQLVAQTGSPLAAAPGFLQLRLQVSEEESGLAEVRAYYSYPLADGTPALFTPSWQVEMPAGTGEIEVSTLLPLTQRGGEYTLLQLVLVDAAGNTATYISDGNGGLQYGEQLAPAQPLVEVQNPYDIHLYSTAQDSGLAARLAGLPRASAAVVRMDGEPLPAGALEAARGREIYLILDEDTAQWIVHGASLAAGTSLPYRYSLETTHGADFGLPEGQVFALVTGGRQALLRLDAEAHGLGGVAYLTPVHAGRATAVATPLHTAADGYIELSLGSAGSYLLSQTPPVYTPDTSGPDVSAPSRPAPSSAPDSSIIAQTSAAPETSCPPASVGQVGSGGSAAPHPSAGGAVATGGPLPAVLPLAFASLAAAGLLAFRRRTTRF